MNTNDPCRPRYHISHCFLGLLVYLSCCDKIPWAMGLKWQKYTSHSFGGWEIYDQDAARFSAWWGPAWGLVGPHFLAVGSHGLYLVPANGEKGKKEETEREGRERTLASLLITKTLTPSQGCTFMISSKPVYFSRALLPKSIILGFKVLTSESWRNANIQFVTLGIYPHPLVFSLVVIIAIQCKELILGSSLLNLIE